MTLNLYRISQVVNDGYDTYDSAVVAAESEDAARRTSPDSCHVWSETKKSWMFVYSDGSQQKKSYTAWVDDLDLVKVELIGTAADSVKAGVIVASFNAG
jgi:hypothetical protein